MNNIKERIEAIIRQDVSNKIKVDALFMLDRDNIDLGSHFTDEQKLQSIRNSEEIIRAIKPLDEVAYEILKKGLEA